MARHGMKAVGACTLTLHAGSGGDAAKARVALAFSDFPAPLRSLIERTSPSTISEHAYFTHDAERLAQVRRGRATPRARDLPGWSQRSAAC